MKMLTVLIVTAAFATSIIAADDKLPAEVAKLLKDSGATSFSHKASYGSGIDDMYLGFDKDSKLVVGIAKKMTKTYKEALTIVAVVPDNGKFKVSAAEIPDIESFHGKSKDLTKEGLKVITGKVYADEKEARGMVDGVTGATKYLEALYVGYSVMSSRVIREMSAKPDWAVKPLPVD
jgi:hypothetical protein